MFKVNALIHKCVKDRYLNQRYERDYLIQLI